LRPWRKRATVLSSRQPIGDRGTRSPASPAAARARNSSFAYKYKSLEVKQIAQELGVQYLLEGSVRRSGQKIRISAQLVEATSGKHIWAERYDLELTEVFADWVTVRIQQDQGRDRDDASEKINPVFSQHDREVPTKFHIGCSMKHSEIIEE
jgi:hypothetical protein